ncbi:hypothetical protein ACWF50_14940 [Brucella pseudogrignonensis]|jgi:hypothetical protein
MPYVRFSENFDWKPLPQITIAHKASCSGLVTTPYANSAVQANEALRLKTPKTGEKNGDGIFDPIAYATNPPVPTPNGNPDYLAEVQNFAAISNLIFGDNGEEHPGIRLFWDAVDDITVEGVDIQYWPDNDPS